MTYRRRILESALRRYLKLFPVVGLTGPRQSGKSTTLKNLLGHHYVYLTFDDPNNVDRFHADPERFLSAFPGKTIFDEIQRVPELFSYIKMIVDNDRHAYGRFVLTGSSQFSMMKHVSESLAGRIGLLTLLPFQYSEIPSTLREASIYLGAYPELVSRNYRGVFEWYTSYLNTYVTRDVQDLRAIGDLRDFRRFLQSLAARVSQILNMSDIARDIGISVPTVKKWISILEASYIVFLVPPFYKNLGKRIVKSPKIYFYDTGLVAHLAGFQTMELIPDSPFFGPLFENYIVSEIHKREVHTRSTNELFYYRTTAGLEVDLIVDRKTSKQLIEIKSGYTYRTGMSEALSILKQPSDQCYLLYRGRDIPSTPDLQILNYKRFFEKH
jgi:hypothetical protein